MSAKLLYSLAGDSLANGRGTGMHHCQLFDLSHPVAGGRTAPKNHRPVYPDLSSSNRQHTLAQGSYAWGVNDTRRVSTESSTASYTSACSSSLISLDSARLQRSEVSSLERFIFPEAPSRNHLKNCSGPHLEDPLEKSWLEEPTNGPADLKDPLSILAKLREKPPWSDEILEGLRSSDVAQASAIRKRPVSVVAKLMGLEAFPDSVRLAGNSDIASRLNLESDSTICRKVHHSASKTVSRSWFPKEPAPGKQQKGANGVSLKSPGFKPAVDLAKQEKFIDSVCTEIERRCKNIEFGKLENDLTALKQILESIGAKGFLETQRGEECPELSETRDEYKVKHRFSSAEEKSDHLWIIEPSKHSDKGSMQRAGRFCEEDGWPLEESVQQSSPVSVLDVSESIHDSPSPVQQTRNSFAEHCDRHHENRHEDNGLLEISSKKLQNVGDLVQKLKRLCSTQDEENTDYISQLCECENPNPDQRYICEILVSSGLLLRDFSSGLSTFQLHPSGHPIDPDLFLVLEQRKKKKVWDTEEDTSRRKIIFDSVNEILRRKFTGLGIARDKLVEETLTAQLLLRELCCEIEVIEAKMVTPNRDPETESIGRLTSILQDDVRQCKDKWTGFLAQTCELVTHWEQQIFEGLVDEIVIRG